MLLKPKRGHDCGFSVAHKSAYPSSMSKNQLCRFVPSGPEVHFVMIETRDRLADWTERASQSAQLLGLNRIRQFSV